jgi:hypothetical protein
MDLNKAYKIVIPKSKGVIRIKDDDGMTNVLKELQNLQKKVNILFEFDIL